jgi:hypothetical protein
VSDGGRELQRALSAARERLGALADRLARSRVAFAPDAAPTTTPASREPPPAPPFGGSDARPIDDLELTFSAVDAGIGVGSSDQDKVR